jgi:hypothetical protein
MTWKIESSGLETFAIRTDVGVASRGAFFEALIDDQSLRTMLTACLRDSRHLAFAWETPALSAATADLDATFAIIDSPSLAHVAPDPSPFAAQLAECDRVATFPLGGDAVLIVPSPRAAPTATHLAAFVRTAPPDVIDDLWSAVGQAVVRRRNAKPDPVWISTAGLGVYWLHVRLDDRPKYYRHRPFVNPGP